VKLMRVFNSLTSLEAFTLDLTAPIMCHVMPFFFSYIFLGKI
jgi:hypothetical protein